MWFLPYSLIGLVMFLVGVFLAFIVLNAVTRSILGIEDTDYNDLEKCTIDGMTNELNELLLTLYRSPKTMREEMTGLKSAAEATDKLFIIDLFRLKLIVEWSNQSKRSYCLATKNLSFQLKMKLLAIFLSTKYLFWLASEKEKVANSE